MFEYRDMMAGGSVVSSQVVMAQAPFKAAEAHVGRPVTLRHQEEKWLRVTQITGGKRTFAYVCRMRAAETTRGRQLFGQVAPVWYAASRAFLKGEEGYVTPLLWYDS